MARKQHPAIGKSIAMYEYHETDPDSASQLFDTPEEALAANLESRDEGDVVYVYTVVGVKVVRKPTLTENLQA